MKKVLSIGNALVDILVRIPDDSFLERFDLAKGSMQLVDMDVVKKIEAASAQLEKHQASGGSAANTIHGLAKLGVATGYIGKVCDDSLGKFFRSDMETCNIDVQLSFSKTQTGRAMALVSPDSERTFATYLGAAVELDSLDLEQKTFKGYDYFHVEGYLVFNHDMLLKAIQLAKAAKCCISLDLASFNVVEANIEFLNTIIRDYIDIVFANEQEAKAFTGKEPEEALDIIAAMCDIAVVKVGKDGSYIKKGNEKIKVKSIKVNALDTTGAGDLYASGFLYGLINGLSLDKCGQIGAITGGNVIEVLGAKMDEERWKKIRHLVRVII